MTEAELVEGMARTTCETESGGVRARWEDEPSCGQAIWLEEARGLLAYLRAHADQLCLLLGGVGPEEWVKARKHLTDLRVHGYREED